MQQNVEMWKGMYREKLSPLHPVLKGYGHILVRGQLSGITPQSTINLLGKNQESKPAAGPRSTEVLPVGTY